MATYRSCNKSEIQLYKVLHKANLLKYFETFIAQGGDDVQQLCEAGEDEFLEIMALVGMANKPLHVRRLQKALQEWITSPSAFEEVKTYPAQVMTTTDSSPQNVSPSQSMERSTNIQDYKITAPQSSTITTSTPWRSQTRETTFSDCSNIDDPNSSDSQQGEFKDINIDSLYNQPDQLYSSFMDMPQPALLEHQVDAIATAAAILAQEMHHVEPKSMPKKPISQEITSVMQMSTDDPNRLKALRKYAAIYGRFDSKRKNARPMSLHEISVNEAAAQLCSHFPALLTRREELFPLARQVVRDSGYQYSKGHSRAAEILVQSKLEPGETVSPPPTILPVKQEDSLSHLQSELAQITLELTELTKEQDRIRSALRKLLEGNDHSQMRRLTAQMDILYDRQTAMVRKRQQIEDTIIRYRKSDLNCSKPTGCVSEPAVTDPSPNTVHLANLANSRGRYYGSNCLPSYNDELVTSNPLNTLYMAALQNHKDSLFQEGLRIAMQYGMSDFAKELIGMKFTRDSTDSEKDSGFSTSSECLSSPGFLSNSTSSPFSALSSRAVNSLSSSSYSLSESGKGTHSLPPSSSPSPAVLSDQEFGHFQRPSGHASLSEADKIVPTHSSEYQISSNKHIGHHASDPLHSSTDEHTDKNYPIRKSISGISNQIMSIATNDIVHSQSCITPSITTTPITTNSGNVIMEAGTRRSSRRKNGDPADYYFTNGGEKHSRRETARQNYSTSSEHTRRLSSTASEH